jgi:hypothetical protein
MAASYCNLIPPVFNLLNNLDRFSVWFLSPDGTYPHAYFIYILGVAIKGATSFSSPRKMQKSVKIKEPDAQWR